MAFLKKLQEQKDAKMKEMKAILMHDEKIVKIMKKGFLGFASKFKRLFCAFCTIF